REPHLGVFLARLSRDSLLALPVPIMLVYAAENSGAPELTVGGFELPFPRILRIEHLIYAGNPVLDRVLVVIFALVMVFMIAGGWLQVRRNFALPIAIGVVMFFLLPDEIAGTYYASWRVLFLAGLVGIASCVPTERGETRLRPVMMGVAVLTLGISAANAWSWRNSELGREAFVALIHEVPEGSAVFLVHSGLKQRQLEHDAVGLYHVGAFAVLERRALVQSLFTMVGQQPL